MRNRLPRTHSSMHMEIHIPFSPNRGVSIAAIDSRTSHMEPKFIRLGTKVSPAPRNTPEQTIDAANIGSAKASIRSIRAPRARISGSGVRIPIICGANIYIRIPVKVITSIPKRTVIQESRFVSCFLPAPMLCPTSVVAAIATPYPGI